MKLPSDFWEGLKKAPDPKRQTPNKSQAQSSRSFCASDGWRQQRLVLTRPFWGLEFGASLVFGAWCLVSGFVVSSFAAPGLVRTTEGKSFEGEIALQHGAVTVAATNGGVEKVTLTNLVLLKIQAVASTLPFKKGSGNGLLGAYFNNANLSGSAMTRLDETIDFNWGMTPPFA